MDVIVGILGTIILALISYFLGRRKNNSEIRKTEADTKKSEIEAEKLDTENKIMQVELFEKLNKVLSEQNEMLLKSNAKLVKSNEIVTEQNKKLLREVIEIKDRLEMLESRFTCSDAPVCTNKKELKKQYEIFYSK